MGIVEQLVDIYEREEFWHKTRMPHIDAINYHGERLKRGAIVVYEENGVVLGYYERYFIGDVCFLHNVWVRSDQRGGRVFRALYKHFFSTMPREITKVIGEKQKIGGKVTERKIYGKY